jgi:hypothetical protein
MPERFSGLFYNTTCLISCIAMDYNKNDDRNHTKNDSKFVHGWICLAIEQTSCLLNHCGLAAARKYEPATTATSPTANLHCRATRSRKYTTPHTADSRAQVCVKGNAMLRPMKNVPMVEPKNAHAHRTPEVSPGNTAGRTRARAGHARPVTRK